MTMESTLSSTAVLEVQMMTDENQQNYMDSDRKGGNEMKETMKIFLVYSIRIQILILIKSGNKLGNMESNPTRSSNSV